MNFLDSSSIGLFSVLAPKNSPYSQSLCSPQQKAERRRVSLAGIHVCSLALYHDLESSLAVSFPGLAGKDIRMFSLPPSMPVARCTSPSSAHIFS